MDQKNFENTKRIAKNTVFLYGRLLLSLVISLFSARILLQALGVDDYGIFNIVGGFIGIYFIISSSLSNAVSRFLTFEIGRNNGERLKEIFSNSLLILIVISIIFLILIETFGVWFLENKLIIPAGRMNAARWVFQASIVGFVMCLLSVPYNALIIAHEKMDVYAYVGIANVLINFANILFVAYSGFGMDRLILFSILTMLNVVLIQYTYMQYCFRKFHESRTFPRYNKNIFKEIFSFAGWSGVGNVANIIKDNGVSVLLNLFFDTTVNAARGIAGSVSNAVSGLSSNFMTSVSPQITKSYASGDIDYMMSIVQRGARFGFYILMILVIPIVLETPLIMSLWLGVYPEECIIFVRLSLFSLLIEILANPLITVQMATGNVKIYNLIIGAILSLNFFLSWLMLKLGLTSSCVYVIAIGVSGICLIARLLVLRYQMEFNIRAFTFNVIINVLRTFSVALLFPLMLFLFIEDTYYRFFLVIVSCCICGCWSILFIGCSKRERNFLISKLKGLCKRKFGIGILRPYR